MLIILLFVKEKLLDSPILYLSLYLKQNRNKYYELLQEVRTHGTWETWIEFFLKGVLTSSKKAIKDTLRFNELFEKDNKKIESLGRGKFSCYNILEYLKKLPQVSAPLLEKELNISAPTARISLNCMVNLGILEEISGKKRDKIYSYKKYLTLLEEEN